MEYTGFWVTSKGVTPLNKNAEASKISNSLIKKKVLQTFIAIVDYYYVMWECHSHTF